MDQKQYEVMTKIMEMSREFADKMFILMSIAGLFDQKYQLKVEIGNHTHNPDAHWMESAELDRKFTDFYQNEGDDASEYYATRMLQVKRTRKGWVIYGDPKGKSGFIPENDGIPDGYDLNGAESGVYPAGETAEQNAPSGNDSLWFHDDDGDPPMVCRGDLNGSMAESGSSS